MSITLTVRGRLKGDPASMQKIHDEYTESVEERVRQAGDISHIVFLNPGERQLLAVDTWESAEHAAAFFGSPQVQEIFGSMFEDKPEVIAWEDPGWNKWCCEGGPDELGVKPRRARPQDSDPARLLRELVGSTTISAAGRSLRRVRRRVVAGIGGPGDAPDDGHGTVSTMRGIAAEPWLTDELRHPHPVTDSAMSSFDGDALAEVRRFRGAPRPGRRFDLRARVGRHFGQPRLFSR